MRANNYKYKNGRYHEKKMLRENESLIDKYRSSKVRK